MQNFDIPASLCVWADWFKPYRDVNHELSMKFILPINVKMPTIVGISAEYKYTN